MAERPTPIELQKYLGGVDYPVSKDDLVDTARRNGAPDDIVQALQRAPGDSFDDPPSVSKAVAEG
jgi:hypothetical protein